MRNWELIEAYFRNKNFAHMEIDSFNQFVEKKLPEIIDENREIVPKIEEVRIEISDIEVLRPRVVEADGSPRTNFFPMEARIRNRTYSSPLFLTMRLLRREVEQDVRRAYIGELPIMLKSNLCWLNGKNEAELIEMGEDPKDTGGYFIINGSEKALMTQEVLASDRVMIGDQTKGIAAEVISTKGAFKGRVRVMRKPDGTLSVTFPASPRKLKMFVLLKALGLKTVREIKEAFPEEKEIENDILVNWENCLVKTEEEALDKIGKFVAPGQVIDYRLRRAQEVIDAFLLPHIGQKKEDRLAKAYYLAMMATKAIERAYGLRGEDDKDHYANKRLELSGKLMEHLFRYSFKYFIKDLRFQIDRTVTRRRKLNISTIVRPGAVSERIRFAMSTGNWIGRATGVSKFMDRVNFLSPLTDLRKVKSPLNKNRELYEARDVHGTHWGRLDPIETPDGPQCVSPDTEILLNDYTATTIAEFGQLWKSSRIAAVDWESKNEAVADVGRYIKTNAGSAFEVTSAGSGRKIIATKDHPFYSERLGKTLLGDLKEGDRVAVLPIKPLRFEKPGDEVIATAEGILKACPEKTDKEYVLRALAEKGLVPLKADNAKLLPVARLLGHIFGDGSLTMSMRKHKSSCTIVCSGTEGDLMEIAKDIAALGFRPANITSCEKTSVLSNGRIISGKSTRMGCYAKPLWVLLKALGAPAGDKTTKETKVPEWIKNQGKVVAREFLASFFGSEMTLPCVDKRNGKIFLQPMFSLNKSNALVANGLNFVEQVRELLERFDVKLSKVNIVYGTKRKSGVETRKIRACLSASMHNLLNLYGAIGFNYCSERKSLARLAYAYTLQKKRLIEKRAAVQQAAIALSCSGRTVSQIFNELSPDSVQKHDIANWVKKHRKGLNKFVRVAEKGFPKFDEWIREHCISENGLVWETIESIKPCQCPDVRDITTVQNYHNFFANGFLTGNCGLVKNLCLMAEVTTETDEAPVEELLYKKGVKLRKL